jgi:hypothetical protein
MVGLTPVLAGEALEPDLAKCALPLQPDAGLSLADQRSYKRTLTGAT